MNLLIVDDEPIVVEGLAYGIDWDSMDILDVYKAYSPAQALEYMESCRVDILITDYSMPEYTGVFLAEAIKRKNAFSRTILISAYDDFEYAKQAMVSGVSNYLLKPIDHRELQEAVAAAIREINGEIEKKNYLMNLEDAYSSLLPMARERLLNQIFTTETYSCLEEVPCQMLSRFEIRLGKYGVLLLLSEADTDGIPPEADPFFRSVVLEEVPEARENLIFTSAEGFLVIPFFFPDEEAAEAFHAEAPGKVEAIQKRIRIRSLRQASIYLSKVGCGLDRMRALFRQLADGAMVDRAMRIVPVVSLRNQGEERVQSDQGLRSILKSHQEELKQCDMEKAKASLDRACRALADRQELFFECKYSFLAMYLECFSLFHLEISQLPQDLAEFFYRPEKIRSLEILIAWCSQVESCFEEQVKHKSMGISSQIIREAKRVVKNCACQDITLTNVADRLYVHPNYLSRLFKEQAGINFSDYVIAVKMEKAKELLGNSRIKIYDIAEQIGYRSVPHFNTMFKKVTGLTPKEYRDQICPPEE